MIRAVCRMSSLAIVTVLTRSGRQNYQVPFFELTFESLTAEPKYATSTYLVSVSSHSPETWSALTFVSKNARIDASIAGDVRVTDTSGYQLDEELIFLRLAREHFLPLPVVLIVGNDALARNGVLRHAEMVLYERDGETRQEKWTRLSET